MADEELAAAAPEDEQAETAPAPAQGEPADAEAPLAAAAAAAAEATAFVEQLELDDDVDEKDTGEERTREITRSTYVQPKQILDDIPPDGGYESAKVQAAFKAANFVGIRSLPNALQPDFRKQLFEEILAKGKKLERGGGALSMVGGVEGKPGAASVPAPAKGQRRPGDFTPAPRMFSNFEWMQDEYDAEKLSRAEQAREGRERWMEPAADFVVTALPPIPKSTGAFNEFEYALDPYETRDEISKMEKEEEASKRLHGPYRVPGHLEDIEQNRLRVGDCISAITQLLSKDWEGSFLRCFEDESGCVAICFNRETMGSEGDVTTYMNQFFRSHPVVSEYALRKDANRWGIVEETVDHVFFVLWPPWVHQRLVPNEAMATPYVGTVESKGQMPGLREPALISGRVPFGPTTAGGVPIPVHTRTFSRSFKF